MTVEPTTQSNALPRRLETDRLILRLFEEKDFQPLFEINSDPETFRFSERGPLTSEEAWARLLRNLGHWDVRGYGLFAVEEKKTGRLVGEAGIADFRRNLGSSFDTVPEASWTVAPQLQGQGYATEAMSAALDWAASALGIGRTVCLIHVRNKPSLSVAEKLGYRPFERLIFKDFPALLLERTP